MFDCILDRIRWRDAESYSLSKPLSQHTHPHTHFYTLCSRMLLVSRSDWETRVLIKMLTE